VSMKKTLRDSTQSFFAGTRNDIKITIADFGGVVYFDGIRLESDGEKNFMFLDKSTYSLYEYIFSLIDRSMNK